MANVAERSYRVDGMTCDHCQRAVTEEVERVRGVEFVNVDLASGTLTVRGESIRDEAVREAVDEAGYAVVGSPA
jgi:copper chaperone